MKKDKLCKTSILSEQHTIHEVEMQGTVKHEEKSVSIFANKKTFYIYFHLILALWIDIVAFYVLLLSTVFSQKKKKEMDANLPDNLFESF